MVLQLVSTLLKVSISLMATDQTPSQASSTHFDPTLDFDASTHYARYQSLRITRHVDGDNAGTLEIMMQCKPGQKLPTADARTHYEMTEIWRDFDRDPGMKVAVIRGDGIGFSAGGDVSLIEIMGFSGPDIRESALAIREKRQPVFK
jgi:hypothetical protein